MEALSRIRAWLEQEAYEGILLSRRDNYAWVTNGRENHVLSSTETGVAVLLVTPGQLWLFADSSDARRMGEEQNPLQAEVIMAPWYEGVEQTIKHYIGDKKIVSDTGICQTAIVQPELVRLRLCLTEQEAAEYQVIGQECANIVEGVCRQAKAGQTERQIAGQIKSRCLEQGISPDCVLVGSAGRIAAYRHPMPTDKAVQDSLMVVLGGQKKGLYISMTRIVYFGGIPREIAEKYKKNQIIFASMQLLMRDGLSYQDYFSEVKSLYRAAGYPEEWQLHHQGGPTGYSCREMVIRQDSPGCLKNQQAYAWNPTITGVKCEETTYLHETGVTTFTRTKNWPTEAIDTPYGSYTAAAILVKEGG